MSLNILAVDDSRTMRDMIRLALEPAGFTVTTADDGVHGVAVLEDSALRNGAPRVITNRNQFWQHHGAALAARFLLPRRPSKKL